MRKALLVASIAIVTMTAVVSAADFGLDFKGGLNMANMRGELMEDDDQKTQQGVTSGIGFQFGLGEKFAIQPEVMFNKKGTRYKYEFEGVDYVEGVNASYLNIPILLKVKIPAGAVVPNFYVGPDMGILLGAKYYAEVDGDKDDVDVKDDFEPIDFGLAMGGGLDFKAGPGRVILDVRYTLGFSNVADSENDEYEAQNGSLGILTGYGIDF